MKRFRLFLLRFITFAGGLYFFLEFVLPKEIGTFKFGAYHEHILKGIQVVGIMAIGLGLISIARVHGGNVLRRRPGAINSAVLLIGFLAMLTFQVGLISDDRSQAALKQRFDADEKFLSLIVSEQNHFRLLKLQEQLRGIEARSAADLGASADRTGAFTKIYADLDALDRTLDQKPTEESAEVKAALQSLTAVGALTAKDYAAVRQKSVWKQGNELFEQGLFVPLGSAMFALLAFYIATAAYRSFRIRSVESFLLMFTAVIVMLGQIPQGSIYISSELPEVRIWLLKNISTPAFRAIFFGSSIAGLAMAIRIWLSLEQNPLSGDEQ